MYSTPLVDSFHDHLNSIDTCIQFIMEESDEQLHFLDILLSRDKDSFISTSVYCTATHKDQYLCFHSHYPAAHKRGEDTDVESRGPLFVWSEPCSEEKLVSQPSREMIPPRVSYTSLFTT